MNLDNLIAGIAGALSMAAFVPQAWQIWRSRSARDVSWMTYAVLISGGLLWIAHGLLRSDIALIVTNAVIVMVALGILAMKWVFADEGEPGVPEC